MKGVIKLTQDEKDLLTVPELAELLGVTVMTAHRTLDRGAIPIAETHYRGQQKVRKVHRKDAQDYKDGLGKEDIEQSSS